MNDHRKARKQPYGICKYFLIEWPLTIRREVFDEYTSISMTWKLIWLCCESIFSCVTPNNGTIANNITIDGNPFRIRTKVHQTSFKAALLVMSFANQPNKEQRGSTWFCIPNRNTMTIRLPNTLRTGRTVYSIIMYV